MNLGKGNLSGGQKLAVAMLFAGPLLVMAGKWSVLPTAEFFTRAFSLTHLSAEMQGRVVYVLSVPFGAVLVVFFRLFLGIRLMGPFRSILLAVAFQFTGIVSGLIFLSAAITIVVLIRPLVKAFRLPYIARVSVILSTVALIMLAALLAGNGFGSESLSRMAYFPIVVLCLLGEGFAKTLTREGASSALWRIVMTAAAAVLIAFLFERDGFRNLFLRYPELLIAEVGCIIVIAEYLDLRLLTRLNPGVAKRSSSRKKNRIRSPKPIE